MGQAAATNVGELAYEVSVDTTKLVQDMRRADREVEKLDTRLTDVSQAAKTHAAGLRVAGTAAREAATANDAFGNAATKAAGATDRHAISTRRLTEALRGGRLALADVATNIATGEGLMRTAAMAASGLGAAFVGIVAGAGGLLLAFVKGRKENEEFNRALELTGNLSGQTVAQLDAMAARLDRVAGVTRGQAAEALTTFVRAGVAGGESLEKFTQAALQLEQSGGPAVESTARAFQALGRDPVDAALKLNRETNFLTVELYRQIKALAEQGKHVEAARVAQTAYADAILERTPNVTRQLGLIERGWLAVKNAAREAWDAVLNVGREQGMNEKLQGMRDRLALLQRQEASGGPKTVGGRSTGSYGPAGAAARRAEIENLQRMIRAYEQAATFAGEAARADTERAAAVEAAADADRKGGKGGRFDSAGYLSGLAQRSADEWQKVTLVEQEAMRRNDELLQAGEINQATHEQAKTLIAQAGAQARAELARRESADIIAMFAKDGRELEAQRQARANAEQFAAGIVGRGDEESAVVQAARLEREKLDQLHAEGLLAEQSYAAAIVANAEQMQLRLGEIAQRRVDAEMQAQQLALASASGAADQMLAVLRSAGAEQTALAKALFLAQKAIAVATIIMETEVGASKALGMGPFGIPLASWIRATGYASAAAVGALAVSEVAGGRRYGGGVSPSSLYRVNEGGQPEMFMGKGGEQYLLPNASGQVIPAGKAGRGGAGVGGLTLHQSYTFAVGMSRAEVFSAVSEGNRALVAELQAQGVI